MKEPWLEFPHIWKTKSSFMSWLRGSIRRACWNKSPIKLEVIKKQRKKVLNEKTGNMVWGGTCYICGNDFLLKDLQTDHIEGNHSLREISDIQSFVEAMTCLSADDLALVCKSCHSAKTYAEKQGMSLEDAIIEKRVIELMKLPVKEIDNILAKHGKVCKNTKDRRDTLRQVIQQEDI